MYKKVSYSKLLFALSVTILAYVTILLSRSIPVAQASDSINFNINCAISLNEVETVYTGSPTVTSVPLIPADPSDNYLNFDENDSGERNYRIKVCSPDFTLLTPDLSYYIGTTDAPVARVGIRDFDMNGFVHTIPLSPDFSGCLVGNLFAFSNPIAIDIETRDQKLPICRREYGQLTRSTADMVSNFNTAQTNFCSRVQVEPSELVIGQPITISANFPDSMVSGIGSGYFRTPLGLTVAAMFNVTNSQGEQLYRQTELTKHGQAGFSYVLSDPAIGQYTASFWLQTPQDRGSEIIGLCSKTFNVGTPENPGQSVDGNYGNVDAFKLCEQIPAGQIEAKSACERCIGIPTFGVWTALGCIETDGSSMISSFITIALGMAGGIGMLMIIAAGAMFTLSRNDPTKVGNAKELLTSVIMGLLFIIFSITILEFIGVTILQIPGFGV